MGTNHAPGARIKLALALLMGLTPCVSAQGGEAKTADAQAKVQPPWPGLVRLAPNVWMDKAKKQIVLETEVVQREAALEQLLCLKGTKEHEAILAVDTRAYVIHAGLLAIGAKPGKPVQFEPKYRPASGQKIDVWLHWWGEGKEHRVRGQQWIYNVRTKSAMTEPWVFAGSMMIKDPQTGEVFYQAEDGDVICVSNFPSAMLDLPIESSSSNDQLAFEAFTERIPPRGTRVIVTLESAGEAARAEKK